MIASGKVFSFWVLTGLMLLFIYLITTARKGKVPKIRRLPALDAIDEAVGRATEMGRPVHFSPGIVELTHERSPLGWTPLSRHDFLKVKVKTNVRVLLKDGNFVC